MLVEQWVDLNCLQTFNLEIRRRCQRCDSPVAKESNNRTMQNLFSFKVELNTHTDLMRTDW